MKQFLFSLMALISTNIIAQNQSVEWVKKIDESVFNQLMFTNVYQSKSNQAFYLNQFYSERYGPDGNPIQYGILTKINSDGTISWNKKQNNLRHLDFIMTNKELITLSSPFDQTSPIIKYEIDQYNLEGNLIKSIPLDLTEDISLIKIIETNDNNFILVGQKNYLNFDKTKGYLVKVDKKGKVIWENTYGNEQFNYITSISISKQGDIFFGGYISKNNSNMLWTVKLSNKGDIIWDKYSYLISSEVNNVNITTDNEGGCSTLTTNNEGKALVVKYDKNGNQQWVKSFNSNYLDVNFVPSNIITSNDKIIFGGVYENGTESKFETIYLDQNGNQLSNFNLGTQESYYYMNTIFSGINNNGLIILDKDYNGNINLTKIGKPNRIIYNPTNDVTISPNPASDYINIQNLLGKNTISIKNINGYEVIRKETNSPNEKISIQNLTKGVYYISIDGEYKLLNYKIIKK